jgi:transglutaminase-like putative cysteine protease
VAWSFVVENRTDRLVPEVELLSFAPCTGVGTQGRVALRSVPCCEVETDGLGNQTLRIRVRDLAPFGRVVVRLEAAIEKAGQGREGTAAEAAPYLRAGPLIEADAAEIRKEAAGLRRKGTLATARAIHDRVVAVVRKAGYVRNPRGALWALRNGRGDCTEAACLFAALGRACGIPCRTMAGYVAPSGGELAAGAYHEWAEFWSEGRWWPADPLGGAFGEAAGGRYVVTHVETPGEDVARRLHRCRVEMPADAVTVR